ncbi:MAG: sensor histidine kinase, partial [Sphingobacteriales bacterium]
LLHRAAAASAEGKINDSVVALSLLSLEISTQHNFLDQMATSYNELGHYYQTKKDYNRSLYYLQKAENVFKEIGYLQDQIIVLRNQVMLYTEMGDLAKAEQVLAKLRDFPQRPSLYKNSYDYSLLESNLWKARGNFKKAYASLDSARRRQAEINWQMHNRQVGELTTKYRTALAEQRALEEIQTATLASRRALKNRFERNTALLLSGLALAMVVMLGVSYYSNRKKNKKLEDQNTAIDKINKLLSDSLLVQEALYNELHHRVKNNLSVLSSLLYLQSSNASQPVKQALTQTRSRVEALAVLHRQLIGSGQLQGEIELSEYIESLFRHLEATFGHSELEVQCKVECEKLFLSPSLVTSAGMVLNELITNSYKHAFAGKKLGKIFLKCSAIDNSLHLLYRDNGPGMPEESDNMAAKSLGLNIIRLLVKQHKGTYKYYKADSVSTFELTFTLQQAVYLVHEQEAINN